MKKIALLQSNYIPWKGYFDLIASVDEFIIYDTAQYTKNDWRNRNKIKTQQGVQWLSVPVQIKGKDFPSIREAKIADSIWAIKHWKNIKQAYSKTEYFSEIADWLCPIYLSCAYTHISTLNIALISAICSYLNITTKINYSWKYHLSGDKNERIIDLCQQLGATEYISGPAAKTYINYDLFTEANIKLTWFQYDGYPVYPQLWGEFQHNVTVLDTLFNCGKGAPFYIWEWRNK